MTPIEKNVVITKLLAPKFCAEWSNREAHSSHSDHLRYYFGVYVSGGIFNGHRIANPIDSIQRGSANRKAESANRGRCNSEVRQARTAKKVRRFSYEPDDPPVNYDLQKILESGMAGHGTLGGS